MAVTATHERIQLRGSIEFIKILDISIHACGNQHGSMCVKGYLNPDSAQQDSYQGMEGQVISLFAPKGKSENTLHPIFSGVVYSCNIHRENELFFAVLHLTGVTSVLDLMPRSRSFQDITMTYRQVVEDVLKDTPNASADFSEVANQPIGKPIIQYQETDWVFIKRLASMLGVQLLPTYMSDLPHFSFGVTTQDTNILKANEYTVALDDRFYELGGSEAGVYKADFICYNVPSVQYFGLGASVSFNEQLLNICEHFGCLADGELLYSYKVGRHGFLSQREIINPKLIGLSLEGNITRTDREIVNIKLDIDAGRDAGVYPFSWTPESGNLMYCMPKLGTRATLYLPSSDTGEAVVVTSPRTNGNNCGDMIDPQMRAFTTEHGKKMHLFPETILFSGGAENETLQIKLNQLNCMLMESTRAIQFVAKWNIDITAPVVSLNSPQEIQTSRSRIQAEAKIGLIIPKGTGGGNPPTGGGDTVMTMQFQFDALGEHGILCGTEFKDYPPFDDAPNEFDFLGWVANIAIGVVIAIVCIGLSIATGGLAGAALAGAAMGALAVTATIAIEDAQDGEVRSQLAAVGQIAFGATAGAAIGATGAYIMPHGVATMSTFVKFGMLSGTTMRVATSNAMEHMDTLDRLWYTFNPTSVLTDGLLGGIFGGVSNYVKLGTAFPSQEMVNLYNTSQNALFALQPHPNTHQHDSSFDQLNATIDDIDLPPNTWRDPPLDRGMKIDEIYNNVGSNYPVIDNIDDTGIVTSVKSRDLTSGTYQNGNTLANRIKRDIDALFKFNGKTWGGTDITAADITGKQLRIVVPNTTLNSSQVQGINSAIQYANSRGIKILITIGW